MKNRTPGIKWCPSCQKDLRIEEFNLYWSTAKGKKMPNSRCRKCDSRYAIARNRENHERRLEVQANHRVRLGMRPNPYRKHEWDKGTKEYEFNKYLIRNYGINLNNYRSMILDQQGRCAICNDPYERTLVVDHCHRSGVVRELLCDRCNTMLGYLENVELTTSCIKYLIRHNSSAVMEILNECESDEVSALRLRMGREKRTAAPLR